MKRINKRITSAALATSLFFSGATALTAAPAHAACIGDNSYEVVSGDPFNGGQTNEIKVDSCKVQQLVDSYGTVKEWSGFIGLLGGGFSAILGVTAGAFYGWAWNNQEAVKDCAKNGTGIKFKEINGIVSGCSPQ